MSEQLYVITRVNPETGEKCYLQDGEYYTDDITNACLFTYKRADWLLKEYPVTFHICTIEPATNIDNQKQ